MPSTPDVSYGVAWSGRYHWKVLGREVPLAVLADGEARLRELEELPELVEEYLRNLPELVGPEVRVREYDTVLAERTPDNPSASTRSPPIELVTSRTGNWPTSASPPRPPGARGSGTPT